MSPTLEEYARFTGLSLEGSCARAVVGHARRQFMVTTGLRRAIVLSEITSGHVISMDFLIVRFASSDSFTTYRENFSIPEDRWRVARVDALMMCLLTCLYMPIYLDHMDVGVVMAVRALRDDQTIMPIILAETYISASYCRTFADREFRGNSVMLYVWFMSHLRPIGAFYPLGYCFGHSIVMSYSFRPLSCTNSASWATFLSFIEESFSVMIYYGLCLPFSFITHVVGLDFLPLAGLRGVTTYHPLAVMGQFNQY